MRSHWLQFFSLLFYTRAFTQNSGTISVKTGTRISKSIPDSVLYQYLRFTEASVYFRNGSITVAQLNNSRFPDEMQFPANNGDTLAIADAEP